MKKLLRHLEVRDLKETCQRQKVENRLLQLEKKEKEIQEQEDREFLEYFKSNWRKELSEGMTTSALFSTTLPATGDEVISQVDGYQAIFASNGGSLSGADLSYSAQYTDGVTEPVTYISGASYTYARTSTTNYIDTTRITQMTVRVSKTSSVETSWRDGGVDYDDKITLAISADGDDAPSPDSYDYILSDDLTTGTYTFNIPSVLLGRTDVVLDIVQNAQVGAEGYPETATQGFTIFAPTFQRTRPVNVFVGLDDPEATNFIRTDPIMQGISAQERRKKLEDMLDAGNEYLLKQLGIQGSTARPADTRVVQSFMDIQVGDQRITRDYDADGNPITAQGLKAATNVAGGTAFNPSLQQIGSRGKGLGGVVKLGKHGTSTQAADAIMKGGFKSGSSSNVYGTRNVFLDPTKSGKAASEFAASSQAAVDAGGDTLGRTARQRAADLASGKPGTGTVLPVAYKPGTGPRMNIPGTKYAEVSASADKATQGLRMATAYPNSAKAQQLARTGATTAKVGAARGAARVAGRAVPIAGATLSVADMLDRYRKGDIAGGTLSGLSAVPGPVGWAALGTQLGYDAARSGNFKGGSTRRGQGSKNGSTVRRVREEKEHINNNSSKRLKSPKEVMNKIPGYYDGKPSPLGFPDNPPPKMVNGFHPDLVDGKKVADRFNRLDPQSARAMPPTGNPHIDKKVRAAAKKPK